MEPFPVLTRQDFRDAGEESLVWLVLMAIPYGWIVSWPTLALIQYLATGSVDELRGDAEAWSLVAATGVVHLGGAFVFNIARRLLRRVWPRLRKCEHGKRGGRIDGGCPRCDSEKAAERERATRQRHRAEEEANAAWKERQRKAREADKRRRQERAEYQARKVQGETYHSREEEPDRRSDPDRDGQSPSALPRPTPESRPALTSPSPGRGGAQQGPEPSSTDPGQGLVSAHPNTSLAGAGKSFGHNEVGRAHALSSAEVGGSGPTPTTESPPLQTGHWLVHLESVEEGRRVRYATHLPADVVGEQGAAGDRVLLWGQFEPEGSEGVLATASIIENRSGWVRNGSTLELRLDIKPRLPVPNPLARQLLADNQPSRSAPISPEDWEAIRSSLDSLPKSPLGWLMPPGQNGRPGSPPKPRTSPREREPGWKEHPPPAVPTPPLDRAEPTSQIRERASRIRRRRRGQGRSLSSHIRRAVEAHAMAKATAHYEAAGYHVEDVSRGESYDLRCTRPGTELHVEVKGTTGNPDSVLITANEERHARKRFPDVDLFVVYGIGLKGKHSPTPLASGGTVRLLSPWDIGACRVETVTARCHLPPEPEKDGQLPLALGAHVARPPRARS